MTNTSVPPTNEFTETQTIPTATLSGLARVRAIARGALTKQWPTRVLNVCPPSYGAVVPISMLGAEHLFRRNDRVALVIFAPEGFQTRLDALTAQAPHVHVHELVGMRKQEVYLSLSAPSSGGKLPIALWVRAADILEKHLSRSPEGRNLRVPVLMVAGSEARVCHWSFSAERLGQIQAATQACETYEYQGPEADKQRALDVAKRYGERPWLFLPYDIKVLGRKHSVNWAPVCTFDNDKALSYELD